MMAWMGIVLRCIGMAGNFVVFRFLFDCPFRSERAKGGALMSVLFVSAIPAIFPNSEAAALTTYLLTYLLLFFTLRDVKVGLVLTYDMAKASIYSFFSGIITAVWQVDVGTGLGWTQMAMVRNIVVLFSFILVARFLRGKRAIIHETLLTIPLWMYLLFTAILAIPTYSYYSTAEEDVLKMEGIMAVVDGLTGIVFTVIIAMSIWLYFQRKELRTQTELKDRCIQEQTGQYRLLHDKQQELRKFRHDSSAHLHAIASLAENAGDQQVAAYVARLIGRQEEVKHLATGNIIGDAVVNQYYGRGLEDDIEIQLMGQFAEDLGVEETDLCVILTNVISNAYEAAAKCTEHRKVMISLSAFRETQFICVQNPTVEPPVIVSGQMKVGHTSKAKKENHGLGLRNILDAVGRTGGTIQWKTEELEGQICVSTEIQLPTHPDNVKK